MVRGIKKLEKSVRSRNKKEATVQAKVIIREFDENRNIKLVIKNIKPDKKNKGDYIISFRRDRRFDE